jgi:hypothetical protein
MTVSSDSPVLRVTKGGRTLAEISDVRDWVTLQPDGDDNSPYDAILWGYRTNFDKVSILWIYDLVEKLMDKISLKTSADNSSESEDQVQT